MNPDLKQLHETIRILGAINRNDVSIDVAHVALIHSLVISCKPASILELGLGTGFSTLALFMGMQFNARGSLTVVDDYTDWGGQEPEIVSQIVQLSGVKHINASEREFVTNAPNATYDFILSDADHWGDWQEEHLRITRKGGVIAFHDTNNPDFPNLHRVERLLLSRGIPHRHFTESSRQDERCERGLLVAFL